MEKLNMTEQVKYNKIRNKLVDGLKKGNVEELKDLRRECLKIFLMGEEHTDTFRENCLNTALDCHQAIKNINDKTGKYINTLSAFEREVPKENGIVLFVNDDVEVIG